MANIHQSITELVGHTPLVELKNYEKSLGLKAHLLGKLEYFNPSGSVKDRAALNMILEAEKDGRLKPGGKILDFTSGNTGNPDSEGLWSEFASGRRCTWISGNAEKWRPYNGKTVCCNECLCKRTWLFLHRPGNK